MIAWRKCEKSEIDVLYIGQMNAAGNETKIHRDDVDTCSNKEIYQAKLEDKHIFFLWRTVSLPLFGRRVTRIYLHTSSYQTNEYHFYCLLITDWVCLWKLWKLNWIVNVKSNNRLIENFDVQYLHHRCWLSWRNQTFSLSYIVVMKHSWKKIVQGKFIRQSFRATSLTALSGSISRIQTDKKKREHQRRF